MKNTFVILFVCLLQTPLTFLNAQSLQIEEPLRFLALGDSYTIGQSVDPTDRWPQQLYDSLGARGYQLDSLQIIARTGWRTDNLKRGMADAQLDSNYNLVSLLIGVNNQFQGGSAIGYRPGFEELLLTAIDLAGGKRERVFVLSIPDYAYTPFGMGFSDVSADIDSFNAVNEQISRQYGIAYYNITPISREGLNDPTLVAMDGLHPSGKMYRQWVELILGSVSGSPTNLADELQGIDLLLSPHSSSPLFLKTDQAVQLRIWNLSGQLVFEGEYMNNEAIPLSLAKGVYVYELENRQARVKRGKLIY